eukprot:8167522-Alexandrium_andersonii.AAC.1
MSASLVGSEMCIRDRWTGTSMLVKSVQLGQFGALAAPLWPSRLLGAVSYTHLTLPTICSV